MRCKKQYKKREIQNTKKIMILILLVSFIMLSLFSETFLLSHAEHEHDHNGISGSCTICVQLHHAENLRKQLYVAVAITTIGFISLLITITYLGSISSVLGLYTPVKLKIRLNN